MGRATRPVSTLVAVLAPCFTSQTAFPVSIYVLGGDAGGGQVAHDQLAGIFTAPGDSITAGPPLGDYTAFEQVWDLRASTALNPTDQTAFSAYLSQGGRAYFSGEAGAASDARNASLVDFVAAVGGGAVTVIPDDVPPESQFVTNEGQEVNFPHFLSQVQFQDAKWARPQGSGKGFLVTGSNAAPDFGSLLAWRFGELDAAPEAKVLLGFDLDMFAATGPEWTENLATYLPEPATMAALTVGALGVLARRRRHRRPGG